MNSNKETLDKIRWQKTKIRNDGFICVVDAMGDDADIVQAARVSYNADTRDDNERLLTALHKTILAHKYNTIAQYSVEEINVGNLKVKEEENRLLRYLMRHRHTTPFEMAEVKFLVRVPMDTWRQWIRHRTASVNEYSTRYTEAIDSRQTTLPGEWRLQATTNKQGSSGILSVWPDPNTDSVWEGENRDNGLSPGEYLSNQEYLFHEESQALYEERLRFGIAKEQARKDLPLSTYTEAYWKCDLGNILHFLSLRMDSHAQIEIREYANAMGDLISQLFPQTWEAFKDYRLDALTLSGPETRVVSDIGRLAYQPTTIQFDNIASQYFTDSREIKECFEKCLRLNLVTTL